MNLAILASGAGSNTQAIIERVQAGILKANIVTIISSNPAALVLEKAAKAGIPHKCIDRAKYPNRSKYEEELFDAIDDTKADCIALAGYMLLLSPTFLEKFKGPIVNLHPALLPAFPGTKGILTAYEYGVKIIGVSVHFVSEEMDRGPLIIQAALSLPQNMSLKEITQHIHSIEHRIYPQALQWVSENRLSVEGRKTFLASTQVKLAPAISNCLIYPPLEEGF